MSDLPDLSVLFVGDVHIKPDNTQSVDILTGELERLCREQRPGIVLLSGDILHTHERVHTTALNKAYDMIRALLRATTYEEGDDSTCKGLVVILVGNHDATSNQIFLTDNHWMNGLKEWPRVKIIDRVEWISAGCIAVPYVPPGRFKEALDTLPVDQPHWSTCSCIFAHQEFKGCRLGAIESIGGDEWNTKWPLVISGHIHDTQRPQANIYYPGASLQQAYGERCATHCVLIESNKDSTKRLPITTDLPIKVPKKKTLHVDSVDKLSQIDLSQVDPTSFNQTRVCLSGQTVAEFKTLKKSKEYKNLVEKGVKVVFKPKLESTIETASKLGKSRLDGENSTEADVDSTSELPTFQQILMRLIEAKKSTTLEKMYLEVVENKIVL